MNVVIKNIIRSVKGHPKENLTILLNMILCTMTVFILLQNYHFLKNHFDLVYGDNAIASHYLIAMSSSDEESMLSDLMNHSPMYFVGQKVNREINDTPHISLYYNSSIVLQIESFKDKEKFSAYSHYIEDEGDVIDVISISENCDKVFNLTMMKGRFFDSSDRDINDPDVPVPVVLGYDYAASFNIGDIIELNGDKAIVIGIMNKNMYMSGYGTVTYIDKSILIVSPFLPRAFDLRIDDFDYQKFQVCDHVYCDNPSVDVQKELNRITTENGYYTYEVQPVDGIEISETKNISAKNVALLGILALIACIICLCSLSSVLYNRTVQDRSVFCIYLCCGTPLWKIVFSIVLEMIVYLIVSFFPTWALSIIEYSKLMLPAWQIFLFSGIIVLVSLIPVFKINKKCNLDLFIRDKIV